MTENARRQALWVSVIVAAFAMVATLPGRTHGLGLVTEPLLDDLKLDRVDYAGINLWATLLGAVFCLPWGWLIDRVGARLMLAITLVALGGVVVLMSGIEADWIVTWSVSVPYWLSDSGTWILSVAMDFFLLVLLTRGLGQSALSVVSITLMGRATGERSGTVIGVYSFLVAAGFMAAFSAIKFVSTDMNPGWRELWAAIGWIVLISGPVTWFVLGLASPKASPRALGVEAVSPPDDPAAFTLRQAVASPLFWLFALATSLYGLIASGVSLFNQSILEERGFDRDVFLTITALSPMVGLASNLASGWLATRWPLGRILAIAMLILAGSLCFFPLVETLTEVYLYAAAMGIAGGMITVLFFAVWAKAYGKTHLGQIQGAAQMLTVLTSALGPLCLALCKERTGSYIPFLLTAAGISGLLAVAALVVPMPVRSPSASPFVPADEATLA